MYFRMLLDDDSGLASYLLADLAGGEAVVIDPRGSDVPVLQAMLAEHRLRLRWVLRTHEHDAQLPPREVQALAALSARGALPVVHVVPPSPVLPFGDEHVQVWATPGHTAGCLSFRWRDRLFCGGLLSSEACPYQSRPAEAEALWDSVTQKVFTLPPETLLFSAHAHQGRAVSTVQEQRRRHPWFGGTGRDEFLLRAAA